MILIRRIYGMKELKYLDYPGNFIKDDPLWLKEKFPNLKE